MNNEEASRVHVNSCVRDSEIERFEELIAGADAGEWRVSDGKVVRYGGKPLEKPGSLALMAASVSGFPRLIRGLRVLEEALRSAWGSASSSKRELADERQRHEQDLLRNRAGQTGPDHEIGIIAEALKLGALRAEFVPTLLRLWAAGQATQETALLRTDIERARQEAGEKKRFREEWEQDARRQRAEVVALLEELKLTKKQREEVFERAKARVETEAPEAPRGRVRRVPRAEGGS